MDNQEDINENFLKTIVLQQDLNTVLTRRIQSLETSIFIHGIALTVFALALLAMILKTR